MRALTIRQPWASLIGAGIKTVETRSWRTGYRGPMVIHAGQRRAPCGELFGGWIVAGAPFYPGRPSLQRMEHFCGGLDSGRPYASDDIPLPLGAVVAVADLVDCVPVDALAAVGPAAGWCRDGDRYAVGDDQIPLGDFTTGAGRYAWLLDDVSPLAELVPARGRQGLWQPDHDLVVRIDDQLDTTCVKGDN